VTTASEILQAAPGLHFWQAYEPAVKCDLTSHAIATHEGLVLVDPIALADPSRLPGPPAAILLTNANHARAAAWWRERTSAPIFAPAAALGELDLVPDHGLTDGDLAPGGLRTIALPGGAPGETAYLGHGLCVVGDALIHLDSHGFALLPAKYCTDAALLSQSLRKLLSCEFDILTFAHGTPLRPHARERLATLLA
jgi:glyoxylase-like metal-dependent hydrolase (beta-lactamase superfamily II)